MANCDSVVMRETVVETASQIGLCDGSILITAQEIKDFMDNPGNGGASNTITDYRATYESDGYVYAGYNLNTDPEITRTINGVVEKAQALTDLETDWTNRLSLTYV